MSRREPHLDTLIRLHYPETSQPPPWTEEAIARAKQTPTAILYGFASFRSEGPFSKPEIALLDSVLSAQSAAVQNGWIFCGFLGLALGLILLTES